jgi:hypothetical protein
MGAHCRRTRKHRCIKRITDLIKRVKENCHEDLTQWAFHYGREDVQIAYLLGRLDNWIQETDVAQLGVRVL